MFMFILCYNYRKEEEMATTAISHNTIKEHIYCLINNNKMSFI